MSPGGSGEMAVSSLAVSSCVASAAVGLAAWQGEHVVASPWWRQTAIESID